MIDAAGGAVMAGGFGHVGEEKFARGGDESGELVRGECGNFAEGVQAAGEGDFGFEDIAESGDDGLIEEGEAEFEIGARGEVGDGDGGVEARDRAARGRGG